MFDSGYALDDTTLEIIKCEFQKSLPQTIVDLGSGKSTIVLAKLAKTINAKVIAVEEELKYAKITQIALDLERLNAEIVIAPIVNGWYQTHWIPESIDFVVVDGPRNPTGLLREPMMKYLSSSLSENAVLVLDDTYRNGESQMLENWCKMGWNATNYNTDRGCAVLRKSK